MSPDDREHKVQSDPPKHSHVDMRAGTVGATSPEFRLDPLAGEWVIIAGGRQSRPALPEECPFCVGGLEAREPYTVKAFTNRWPVMRGPDVLGLDPSSLADAVSTLTNCGEAELYHSFPALGEAEVVLYSPNHKASLGTLTDDELWALFSLWKQRTQALSSREYIRYVLIFENRGPEVGVTIEHPHGQIYGFPFVPPRIVREMERGWTVRARRGIECLECWVAGREARGPRAVFEDEYFVAYVPYASAWPYALHIVPKRHSSTVPELKDAEAKSLMNLLRTSYAAADRIFDRPLPTMMAFLQSPSTSTSPKDLNAAEVPVSRAGSGNLNLNGENGSNTASNTTKLIPPMSWHLRVEIVSPMRKPGLLRYVAGAEVYTSVYQNPVRPEDSAAAWRKAFEQVRDERTIRP